MIVSPETIAFLKKSKQGQEFMSGVRRELLTLELLSGMPELKDPMEIAVETLGRTRAIAILKSILEPFYEPVQDKDSKEEEKEVY